MNVTDYVGTFTVRQGTIWNNQQVPEIVGLGDQIQLGMGTAAPPTLQPNGEITIGMAVLDASGQPKTSLPGGWPPAFLLEFTGTVLRFHQSTTGQPPRRLTITLVRGEQEYRAIAGNVIVGDPQQAGVWGADDEPDTSGGGGG